MSGKVLNEGMTTTQDIEFEDYYEEGPALTEAEIRHIARMNECHEAHKGGSFDATIASLGYCADVVEAMGEDGRYTTRCLDDAVGDTGACEGHLEERLSWAAMSEPERASWEREADAW